VEGEGGVKVVKNATLHDDIGKEIRAGIALGGSGLGLWDGGFPYSTMEALKMSPKSQNILYQH